MCSQGEDANGEQLGNETTGDETSMISSGTVSGANNCCHINWGETLSIVRHRMDGYTLDENIDNI